MKKAVTAIFLLCMIVNITACGSSFDNAKTEDSASVLSADESSISETGTSFDQDADDPKLFEQYAADLNESNQEAEVQAFDQDEMEYREYKTIVAVSTIEELVGAIENDTRIILKTGEYNFSSLDGGLVKNPNVIISKYDNTYDYYITGISNLSIEAQEGADVRIVTENAYDPVLSFMYCSNIRLDGLTCGHNVEPGMCSGSVIYCYRASDMGIENCSLFGSGTYGVETSQCQGITVSETEIYECSDGIFHVNETNQAEFLSCSFHDNNGSSLFQIMDSIDVVISETDIYNNHVSPDIPYNMLMQVNYSENVTLSACTFNGNDVEPDPVDYPNIEFAGCNIKSE